MILKARLPIFAHTAVEKVAKTIIALRPLAWFVRRHRKRCNGRAARCFAYATRTFFGEPKRANPNFSPYWLVFKEDSLKLLVHQHIKREIYIHT
jgi:hypothetical protein